jgi:hypothetical protein
MRTTQKTLLLTVLAALAVPAIADVTTGIPDAAPLGFEWVSPIVRPALPVIGQNDWKTAAANAHKFVAGLTLDEKINITTGVDVQGTCIGNTGYVFFITCSISFYKSSRSDNPAHWLEGPLPPGLTAGCPSCRLCKRVPDGH